MATKTLSKLKVEMVFNQDLTRLVDVMKGVAAAQYFVMERKRISVERYSKALEELFQLYDFRTVKHPFVKPRNDRRLIVLVTTDSGFLGGLNMKVVNAGLKLETNESHYLVIGERGVNYIKEHNRPYTPLPGISMDSSRYDLIKQVIDHIFQAVGKEKYGQVVLVYPMAVSFTVQRIESINVIPCPMFYKEKGPKAPSVLEQEKQVILESPANGIVEYLTRLWLRKRLVEIFELSKLAEFGARTMHLEDSFQTLSKINKQLKLDFFKARREKIDQSLRESFTSQTICD